MTRSEGELLAAHLAGDPLAFGELFNKLYPRLWVTAIHTLDSREDAAEAVLDALTRAHQGAAGFRADSSVATWVHRILLNVCRDRHRHNRSRPAIPMPSPDFDQIPGHRNVIAERELISGTRSTSCRSTSGYRSSWCTSTATRSQRWPAC